MMLIPLKQKYLRGKLVGYKSKHNDGSRRKLKNKASDKMKVYIQSTQPNMVRVVSPTGKARMVRREQ
jgi:hypothetical protein